MINLTEILFVLFYLIENARGEYFDIDKEQKKFLSIPNPNDSKLFKEKNWYLHNPSLFREMKEHHAKRIMDFLLESRSFGDNSPKWKNPSVAQMIFSQIRGEDIEVIKSKGVCIHLGIGIKFATESFGYAHKECAGDLVKLSLTSDKVLQFLPANLFQNYPKLAVPMKAKFFGMNNDTLKVLLGDGIVCKRINAKNVAALEDAKILKLISPKCFSEMINLSETNLTNIGEMRKEILTNIHGRNLTRETIKKISFDQMKGLQGDESVCASLELSHLSVESAGGVLPSCMESYLEATSSSGPKRLDKLWTKFNSNILSSVLSGKPRLIKYIHERDYAEMDTNILNSILKVPEACEYILHGSKLDITSSIKIEKDCFARLDAKLQPLFIAGIKTPSETLLEKVDSKMMSRWQYHDSGQTLRGFQVLRLLSSSNLKGIIQNMSKQVSSSEHACGSIPNASTLLSETAFLPHVTKACAKALSFKLRAVECYKYPRLWVMQNSDLLSKGDIHGQESIVPHLTEENIKGLVKSKKFCTTMSFGFFRKLKKEVRKGINKNCFAQITFKKRLEEEDFKNFSEDILSRIGSKNFGDLRWGIIPEIYLKNLSKDLEGNESAFQKLSASDITSLGKSKVTGIPPEQWQYIDPKTFSAIKPSQIEVISSEAVEYWNEEQVSSLEVNALKALNVSQLERLGLAVDKRAILPLEQYIDQMDKAKQNAFNERKANLNFNWKVTGAIIVITAAIIGVSCGVIYFGFMRGPKKIRRAVLLP